MNIASEKRNFFLFFFRNLLPIRKKFNLRLYLRNNVIFLCIFNFSIFQEFTGQI